MEQLVIAIALWCGSPVQGGPSNGQIDSCRVKALDCFLAEQRFNNVTMNDVKILNCFKNIKIAP